MTNQKENFITSTCHKKGDKKTKPKSNDKKVKKSNAGRPTVVTDSVVCKLLEAFSFGADIKEACAFAEICRNAYYDRIKKDVEFSNMVDRAREQLVLKAKKQLNTLINMGDANTVRWYLERKKKDEFSTKTEVDNKIKIEDDTIKVTIG